MLRIARLNVLPLGGYVYTQPETGMKFNGNETFRAQCRLILAHRKGNRLPRATLDEVAIDLEASVCQRVPGVCMDSSQDYTAVVAQHQATWTRGCGSCGGRKA